jgi:Recombination enhancement, RecA-dependent nuclease
MTKDEKAHKAALVEMGCIICERQGNPGTPPQLHHLRTGGWGKGDYKTLIPLCYYHHQGYLGIHTMGTKAWERHFGVTQRELLNNVLERL